MKSRSKNAMNTTDEDEKYPMATSMYYIYLVSYGTRMTEKENAHI